MHGTHDSESLLIDEFIDAGNKVLAVTGGLELFGQTPNTIWTRLTEEVDAGATSISVLSADGWKVGD